MNMDQEKSGERLALRKVVGAFFITAMISAPALAADLVCAYGDGQTFLKWNEINDPSVRYQIYRGTQPFQVDQASQTVLVGDAELLGDAAFASGLNKRRSGRPFLTPFFPMTKGEGLYVHTIRQDTAIAYYAVFPNRGGQRLESVEDVSFGCAVSNESVAKTVPFLQENVGGVRYFTHWGAHYDTAVQKAFSNTPSSPFTFGIEGDLSKTGQPLFVGFHPRRADPTKTPEFEVKPGSFDNPAEDEIVYYPEDFNTNLLDACGGDDTQPSCERGPVEFVNDFWYGYPDRLGIRNCSAQELPRNSNGQVIIRDYSRQRVLHIIGWLKGLLVKNDGELKSVIDPDRVYAGGYSMGGIGALFTAVASPDVFAAVMASAPKFNFSASYSEQSDQWDIGETERCYGDHLWGDMPSSTVFVDPDGLWIYDRLNLNYLVDHARVDLPIMYVINGKNDNVVSWDEKPEFYQTMEANKQLGYFFWDQRVKNGKTHTPVGGEWDPMIDFSTIYAYRKNQSYPVFTHVQGADNPGSGSPMDGDAVGVLNGYLTWETHTIVDTPVRFRMTLKLRSLRKCVRFNPERECLQMGRANAPSSILTADVSLRGLQSFEAEPKGVYLYKATNPDNPSEIYQSGLAKADPNGLITIEGLQIRDAGVTLFLGKAEDSGSRP
ncbi:alpha/beta hydrolase family protein [Hahella sp. NBU794]|uniref:alpha/beta hydrolase family protein n=1 Tax=Hahella sp. NBU794 TaxID=3422590 RepID=UPI003D6F1BED